MRRDIHYIWLAAQERPDFVTINRFRNRIKDEINNIFTQVVLLLAERGFITLDVEYIDGTKIESKANKYTFVWRKTVVKNRAKLKEKIRVLLQQIDEVIEVNHRLNEYKHKARELLTSETGLRHRGRRCIEPEAVFGQMKFNMAYRRFRHFGKDKVTMDFASFAIAFNIKKMWSKIAKQTKNGGNTPPCSLFLLISRFLSSENRFFLEKSPKISCLKNIQTSKRKKRGCAYFDTASLVLHNTDVIDSVGRCLLYIDNHTGRFQSRRTGRKCNLTG